MLSKQKYIVLFSEDFKSLISLILLILQGIPHFADLPQLITNLNVKCVLVCIRRIVSNLGMRLLGKKYFWDLRLWKKKLAIVFSTDVII